MTQPRSDAAVVPDEPRRCEVCGGPVGAERLEALPRALTCFACANRRKPPSRGRARS